MFPKLNPKDMERAMKQLGIKQEPIDAVEVIIKCSDKELIIKNPQVSKVDAMGQKTIQIIGDIEERSLENFNEDDVKTVIDQTGVSDKEARDALKKNDGDLAKTIMELKS